MINTWKTILDRVKGKAPKGARRSKSWRKLRKKILTENPRCAVCEGTKKLEVHHIIPFHVAPDLELNEINLMVLCESKKYGINCHLLIGHHGNYRKANMNAISDAFVWNGKIKG